MRVLAVILALGAALACSGMAHLPHVKTYERVIPQRLHSERMKRDLAQNVYPEHARYALSFGGKNYTLQLEKNRELLSKNYSLTYYLGNGTEVTETWNMQDHCFYHGHLEGENDSSASINTCNGISGFLHVDRQMYLIEPLSGPEEQGVHAVYKHEHLRMKRGVCQGSNITTVYDYGPKVAAMLKPQPWGAVPMHTGTKYVELYLVVDNAEYRKYKDMATLHHRMKEIVNHVDKLYRPLKFRVALIGMEVWTYKDKITVSSTAGNTLDNFLKWRKSDLLRKQRHDNAQLITGIDFDGSTVGLATKLAMCTGDSGGINQDHSANPIGVAATMAHEMGHNLGMSHDEDVPGCRCVETKEHGGCVMAQSVGLVFPKMFSSCSQADLQTFLNDVSPTCLLNTPDTDQLYGGPVCGNQFVEKGEECDCGSLEDCTNPCCNATTCLLKEGAQCAQGECCQQCKIRPVGEMCRRKKEECDLPEYCTGVSAECPEDAYQENGVICRNSNGNSGYCYNGECPSHSQQCKGLWGSEAEVAPDVCFKNNVHGNKHLHCKKTANGYQECKAKDIKCGRLHCVRGKDFPITNKKYVLTLHGGLECKVAEIADAEIALTSDPGMVLSGTKCGMGMVCLEGECRDISVFGEKNCSAKCNNRGVCNQKRQCHCDPGWAPPYCDHKFTEIGGGAETMDLVAGILVAVLLFAVLIVGGIYYYKWRQRNYPQKSTVTVGSRSSGLSNPLFQDNRNPTRPKKDFPSHVIGRPQLIASTSNLEDSRSAFINIIPNEEPEEQPKYNPDSHLRSPVAVPKSPQVTKPRVAPPGPPPPPVKPQVSPVVPQAKGPPNKPLPALKTRPKVALRPPIQRR
uniref:ADAM metallopeptidase domain 8 n=1 Tax=Leptobrachium leishanense TaxID=445787 RepID=A0A8C5WER3_9ANUR